MQAMRIGVKYCGGCREQYDRKAGFVKIRESVAGPAGFLPVEDGGSYDALLVMCGCPTRCADISGYTAARGVLTVDSADAVLRARDELDAMPAGEETDSTIE